MNSKNSILLFFIICILLASCADNSLNKFLPNSITTRPVLCSLDVQSGELITNSLYGTDKNRYDKYFQTQYHNSKPSAITYGRLIYSVKEKHNYLTALSALPLSVLSALSLGTLNLLGMPFGFISSRAEVRTEIYNTKGDLIDNSSAIGKGTAYGALYYGYPAPGEDITSITISKAINSIFELQKDKASFINSQLIMAAKEDSIAWKNASTENTIAAYEDYIQRYIYGYHLSQANTQMARLQQAEQDSLAWTGLLSKAKLDNIAEFIASYGNKKFDNEYRYSAQAFLATCLETRTYCKDASFISLDEILPLTIKEIDRIACMHPIQKIKTIELTTPSEHNWYTTDFLFGDNHESTKKTNTFIVADSVYYGLSTMYHYNKATHKGVLHTERYATLYTDTQDSLSTMLYIDYNIAKNYFRVTDQFTNITYELTGNFQTIEIPDPLYGYRSEQVIRDNISDIKIRYQGSVVHHYTLFKGTWIEFDL